MNYKVFLLLFFCCIPNLFSQEGFQILNDKNKITVPFKLLNNLIILPVEVNGVSLNFLIDTGVEQSILFSLDETDEVQFEQIEKIKIKGFGINDAFDGFKSVKNTLKINDFVDYNHTLFLVLDQNINISSQVGFPVNGILGYHFFKNHKIKIDYNHNKITFYSSKNKTLAKNLKSFSSIPIIFHESKPYLYSQLVNTDKSTLLRAKLLIDTGNSDAVWLFENQNDSIQIAEKYFDDYLGRGFSGDVFGKRARILKFNIADFEFSNPLISYPDAIASSAINPLIGRVGSVGSELLRRFTIIFDYPENKMYLKKNLRFKEAFNFNMSGIDIQHQGLQWVTQTFEEKPLLNNNLYDSNGTAIKNNLKYKFELKPIYIITNIRKNSPAEFAGLKKDDIIRKINKKEAYNFSLQEINDLLKSEEGKTIEFEVERNYKAIKFKFQLKSML